MPELGDISYSRDVTVRAFRDYYRFLIELYMDDSNIIEPPEEGWPSISPSFQQSIGKSDEVVALLRNLPYIRIHPLGERWDPPQGSAHCYWADWRSLAEGSDGSTLDEGLRMMTEGGEIWENVPPHVIGLAYGNRENPNFLLDTQLGIVYWSDWDGGHGPRNDSNITFIEPVWDSVFDYAPEKEVEWRKESQAWATADFFELLKTHYRNLDWVPTSPNEVVDIDSAYDVVTDGMIPILQGIYRQHGWSLEGGAHYRKRECLEAVKAVLKERYPDSEDS